MKMHVFQTVAAMRQSAARLEGRGISNMKGVGVVQNTSRELFTLNDKGAL